MIAVEFKCLSCGNLAVRKYPKRLPEYCSIVCRNIGISRKRWAAPRSPRLPKPPMTADRVRELLSYNPETGLFTRLSGRFCGSVRACQNKDGYIKIVADGRQYPAHRLAWLYMTGVWPAGDTDHANMIRWDNRWVNLREATRSQNRANTLARSDNTSGVKGVHWDAKRCRWRAQIQLLGKKVMLGSFSTCNEAREAYHIAAVSRFKEFARVA